MEARARRDPAEVAEDSAGRARDLALRILTAAPKSTEALRQALLGRGIDEVAADAVIVRFREAGLLDDMALAKAIARSRHRERSRSRRAIAGELRRKGFGEEDIESALKEISDEEEARTAKALVERRWQATMGLSDETRLRRVAGALGRRGYPPGLALSLVGDLKRADIWDNPQGRTANVEEE